MNDFLKNAYKKISKLTPEQVSDLMQTLISEKENLSSIFESLSTGLIIVDTDWQLLHHNKAAERLVHFSSRFSDQDKIEIWNLIENKEISEYLHNCASNQKSNAIEEFSISMGDTFRFITVKIGSLVVKDGYGVGNKVAGSIITVDDITQQRQSEILLHRMESLASLTNLAASVAHEVKNPLGAISIHIQLLQKAVSKARNGDGLLPEQKFMENYLSVINEEIDRLNSIIVDFLFAVRPVQANMQLANPNDLLLDFISFFTPEFEDKNITVEMDLCKNSVRIMLDDKLFREVIINIIQNAMAAIESLKKDTINADQFDLDCEYAGKISISSVIRNEKFIISIKDNGTGMDETTSSRIFEPYYTTKATGTGLGLTTVYKIIKEFQGDIQVRSSLGKGTVFKISLPIPQKNINLLMDKSVKASEDIK